METKSKTKNITDQDEEILTHIIMHVEASLEQSTIKIPWPAITNPPTPASYVHPFTPTGPVKEVVEVEVGSQFVFMIPVE